MGKSETAIAEDAPEREPAPETLRSVWTPIFLAQEMEEGLGRGQNLFSPLQGRAP
jgi:hypothetical protein